MLKAITFDFWNTLYKGPADAVLDNSRAKNVQKVLAPLGYQFTIEEISRAFKQGWKTAYQRQRWYGEDIGPRGQVACIVDELGLKLDKDNYEELYQVYTRTLLQVPPQLNDDVRQTLPVLAQKYQLAVICNTGASPGTILRQILNKDGIGIYFNYLVFSDEVKFAKPNPRIFSYTLDYLKVKNTWAAHIGDDVVTDVIGARKAGMTAIWLCPSPSWPVLEADYHIERVGQLLNII
ncbi:HAD family hydrolase [Syntrophomonas erecta]